MSEDPHECCKSGSVHSGTPVGHETKLEGLDVYISEPPTPSGKAVLFIHDGFGWALINNRLLADAYAKEANVRVFLPNFLKDEVVPAELLYNHEIVKHYDFAKFAKANNREDRWPTVLSFTKSLKEKHGVTKLVAIGFCWGGWASLLLAGTDDVIDAVAVAHPSLVKVPDDIENIKKPALFLCAEKDMAFTAEARQQSEAIMAKKSFYSLFKLYPGTVHGFSVRGDLNNKAEADAAEAAKKEAVEFFKRVL